ncbi:MAG TPA: hypothetical protein VFU15_11740 [Bacteroidia bacterium]|nr:hypothetical protein [Bacteroidia bacterium]
MVKQIFLAGNLVLALNAAGQATFNASAVYTQNFGTSTVATWTDNSTFPGWYALSWKVAAAGTDPFRGTTNITAAAPVNSGGWYVYQCNGGTDMKLGTRPSNSSGGPDSPGMDGRNGIALGLCLQNNLPTINSLVISFDSYQLSLADEGGSANTVFFDYLVSAGIPALSAAGYTNVATLNFTPPQSSGIAGSAQINGYPCPGNCQTVNKSACITVNIPSGSYIMLRWWDPNDGSNDPHVAIDNVSVTAYSDNLCATVLPIELLGFNAKQEGSKVTLNWSTATETNNDFFTVERAGSDEDFHPVATVSGNGTTTVQHSYSAEDLSPENGINYYRLRQTDYNGQSTVSDIVTVNFSSDADDFSPGVSLCGQDLCYSAGAWNASIRMTVYDMTGRKLAEQDIQPGENGSVPLPANYQGMLIVSFVSEDEVRVVKIIP